MNRVRPPAVAGSFYPADASELSGLLDECFVASPLGPQGVTAPSSALVAGMVPHAGYIYSGPCAAHLYALLEMSVRRVILLGVNHQAGGHKAALSPWERWRTPLGEVTVDQELNDFLAARVRFLRQDDVAHAQEHSIEVQLPFLQRVLGDFTFLPVSLSHLSREECAELGAAIAEVSKADSQARTLVLASSDLSHYLSPRETDALDQMALEQVLALSPDGLLNIVEQENISMCGVLPTTVMLFAANALGLKQARLLKHCHSGDVSPMRKVVGYASVAIGF
jgi:AmmeMemoRadiSam system protein B